MIHSLPPIADPSAAVLVLGTMPGKESLRLGQYYAHARNLFWPFAGEILGFDASQSYATRIASLLASKVALWDVLQLCTRESSLDSDIEDPVANDFVAFLAEHPQIERVCFNGKPAARLFRKHVEGKQVLPALSYVELPSTSPANAGIPRVEKLARWRTLRVG